MEALEAAGLRLTLDELEAVEDLLDCPASKWEDVSQGKMMKAMVYTLRKRDNPKVTMKEIGKLYVADLEAELAPFVGNATAAT